MLEDDDARQSAGLTWTTTGQLGRARPHGGIKQSGLGREARVVGIDEYLEHQYAAIPIR